MIAVTRKKRKKKHNHSLQFQTF